MTSTAIYTPVYCSCVICHEVKSVKGIHSHYITAHTKEGNDRIKTAGYNGGQASKLNTTAKSKSDFLLRKQNYEDKPNLCKACGRELSYNQRKNKFCSSSCAASINNLGRKQSDKQKTIAAKTIKLIVKPKFTPVFQCKICGKWGIRKNRTTCSDTCLLRAQQNYGKRSATSQKRRSKDEIKLYELCNSYFSHVENNVSIFNGWDADIIIHDIKLAILWNGPWHYKEMKGFKHSLKQVQNRDRIKIKEIKKLGWSAIIFEDRYYTPEQAFSELVARVGNAPTLTVYETDTPL